MFTPSSAASVVTSASTPGTVGHGDAHLGELVRLGDPAGRLRRRGARPLEPTEQRRAVRLVDRGRACR